MIEAFPWDSAPRFLLRDRDRIYGNEFVEGHLLRILRDYFTYCHGSRTHLGVAKDCPEPRGVEPPEMGPIEAELNRPGITGDSIS